MKILYIVSAPITFCSSANIRNISLIKGLLKLGHDITIMCSNDISLKDRNKIKELGLEKCRIITIPYNKPIKNKKVNKNIVDKNLANRMKKLIRNIFHKISIYDHYQILINNMGKVKEIEENIRYDFMITSSDPKSAHLIGKWIYKNHRKIYQKWIQIYGDPITLDITSNLILPKWYIKKVEQNLISISDKIFYVSPLTVNAQKKIFHKISEKINIIPLSYAEADIHKNFEKKNNLSLGYCGDYYSSIRNIKPLYECIKKNPQHNLNIIGNSDLNLEPTDNINIKERVDFCEIKNIEKQIDVLVAICNTKGTQIPGKIFQYAGTNKVIILIIDGDKKEELKDYFIKFNRFIIVENEIQKIEDVLNNIEVATKDLDLKPVKEFSNEIVAKEFCKLIEK